MDNPRPQNKYFDSRFRIPIWPSLIAIGVGVTLATVIVPWMGGYGFPFAWKNGGCPPPGIAITVSCLLAIGVDWLNFGLDVLFYTVIFYGLLFAYATRRARSVRRNLV